MHAIDCLGRMIMGSNQHYRWVLEVKWSTVVVSRTNPIKGGQILTPPIFSDCVLLMLSLKPKCRNIKLKTPLQSQRQVALNAILKKFNSTFSFSLVITDNTMERIQK